jgi:2-hydroxychromene-2-carboxylate isomerase
MGDLVHLDDRRNRRRPLGAGRPRDLAPVTLYIDLADPFSYLAAERVERFFPAVTWAPAAQAALEPRHPVVLHSAAERLRDAARRRAAELRLPLQWPERFPESVPAAMRAAVYAQSVGRGGAFVLAAGRLAFGGGYDLDEPAVLQEAAAAARVPVRRALAAARDERHDAVLNANAQVLLAKRAEHVPALLTGDGLVTTETRISAYLLAGVGHAARRAADFTA